MPRHEAGPYSPGTCIVESRRRVSRDYGKALNSSSCFVQSRLPCAGVVLGAKPVDSKVSVGAVVAPMVSVNLSSATQAAGSRN